MNKKIQIIAHRGASKYAPENTIAAFNEAKHLGVNYIECDVMFSNDKIPFIFHDDLLNRTTNADGPIKVLSWNEIRQLDAGGWFSDEYAGEPIPSLAELLEWHQSGEGLINIEIKYLPPSQLEEKLIIILDFIEKYQGAERLILSSFQPELIKQLYKLGSPLKRALLIRRWNYPSVLFAKSMGCEQLNIGNLMVRPYMVHKTHDIGLKLGVYTVNQFQLAMYLESIGVDAIFTDDVLLTQSS